LQKRETPRATGAVQTSRSCVHRDCPLVGHAASMTRTRRRCCSSVAVEDAHESPPFFSLGGGGINFVILHREIFKKYARLSLILAFYFRVAIRGYAPVPFPSTG
jgi:hypothetical protein